jgi:hypothetical protein
MELGNDPSELLNALDDASCFEAAVPDRRVGVVFDRWHTGPKPYSVKFQKFERHVYPPDSGHSATFPAMSRHLWC